MRRKRGIKGGRLPSIGADGLDAHAQHRTLQGEETHTIRLEAGGVSAISFGIEQTLPGPAVLTNRCAAAAEAP